MCGVRIALFTQRLTGLLTASADARAPSGAERFPIKRGVSALEMVAAGDAIENAARPRSSQRLLVV